MCDATRTTVERVSTDPRHSDPRPGSTDPRHRSIDPRHTSIDAHDQRTDPRHRLGALGEQLAAEHLVRRGFRILERNYRTRWGELDIVAFDGQTLAFCEVKTRRIGQGDGTPFESLHEGKRRRVRKMAGSWMRERGARPVARAIRCDAIAVTFDRAGRLVAIEHLEGAF
jgi:putative endonuclease